MAEIADAANISVKTLFTYFRSKEDLAFADEYRLRNQLVEAIRSRPAGSTPVQAVAALLGRLVDGSGQGLEDYHRGYGGSDALASRLRRMWESYEEAVAGVLAAEAVAAGTGGPHPGPSARLTAALLVAMVRSFTWPEVLAGDAGPALPAGRPRDAPLLGRHRRPPGLLPKTAPLALTLVPAPPGSWRPSSSWRIGAKESAVGAAFGSNLVSQEAASKCCT